MTEKAYVSDVLEMEKNMTVNMAIALNEASNDSLYKALFKMFEEISLSAKNLFEIAYDNNWYQLEKSQPDKIKKEIQKLSKELSN